MSRKFNEVNAENWANVFFASSKDQKVKPALRIETNRNFYTVLIEETEKRKAAVAGGKVSQKAVADELIAQGYVAKTTLTGMEYFNLLVLGGCAGAGKDPARAAEVVPLIRDDEKTGQKLTGISDSDLEVFVYAQLRDPKAQQGTTDVVGIDVLYNATSVAGGLIYSALKDVTVSVGR